MADNRTASVTLRADTTQYQRAMRQASSATSEMDKAQAKAQRNAQRWEAIGMASKVAGAAVAAGLLYATKAASDQEQAVGALTATFRENSAAMQANARDATQIGLSITDYSNAAAKLGGQLSNLGVDQKDLGVTTDDLINKAADLAAQYGGTTMEAVDALGAAFRGEADPAERYSLALNQTQVAAEQAATGYDKAGAMLSLINKQMEKTGSAGAAMREFDTAAASVARAQAEFDNATAALGEALIPALTTAAQAAADLIGVFNDMPQPVKEATTYMVAFGGAALIAGPKIAGAAKATGDLVAALLAAGKFVGPLSALTGGLAAIPAGLGGTGFIMGIRKLGEVAGDLTGLPDLFKSIGSAIIGMFPGAGPFMLLADQLNATKDLVMQWLPGDFDLWPFDEDTDAAAEGLEALGAAGGRAAAGVEQSADASWKDAEAKENQAAATQKAVEAYEAYLDSVRQALGLLDARDALIGQEERLAEAVKENGAAIRGRTKAAAANREALSGEAENIANLVQQTYENVAAKKDEAAGLRAANRVRREQIRTLLDNAEAAGLDRDQVQGLLRQLNLLKPINTSVTVSGLSEAERKARSLVDTLIQASGLGAFGIGNAPRPKRRAAGGYISGPGGPTADKIPAMLSNGEYVMRASAVSRLGVGFFDALNYANGGPVRYARGGATRGGGGGGRGPKGMGPALREVEKWTGKVKEARRELSDLRRERDQFAESFSAGVVGRAGPSIFQQFSQSAVDQATSNLNQAQQARESAEAELQAARVAFNNSSPEERAAAMDRLAKAQQGYNDAVSGEASAQAAAAKAAPTGDNILAAAKERADRVVKYARDVKTLMSKGMSMAMIKELAGEDILQAGPVIDALLKMPPEQFAELQAADARMRAAADSLGESVAKKEYKPQMLEATINLDASDKSLNKAIKKADKTVDKKWRKQLAKIGLSAEERVDFMRSLRDNDGKLTRYWRNVLAKAGLGAEERKELLEGIGFADQTAEREWRSKLQKTGLSAEERKELAEELAAAKNPERTLRRYWIDELQETKLSAKESKELYDEIVDAGSNPSRNLQKEWIKKLQETGLSARESADLISKIQGSQGAVNDNWTSQTFRTGLDAERRGLDATVTDERNRRAAGWGNDKFNAGLDAERRGLAETVQGERGKKGAGWGNDKFNAGLDAERRGLGETVQGEKDKKGAGWGNETFNAGLGATANAKGIAAGVAAGKSLIKKGFSGFTIGIGVSTGAGAPVPGKKKKKSARGGLVLGPGTATSDSIPAMLSNGEYVIRAAAVSKYGRDLMDAINVGRFAAGGPVGFRTTTTAPAAATSGVTVATSGVPVVVKLDNRTVATGQLKLQRQSGGTVTLGG